jgi:5'-3' exonuclease
MKVHLVDGTYELFRQHFARPAHVTAAGEPVAATRGVLESTLGLFRQGATHVGVATDHVIESFRNDMWPGYKTSAGMPAELLSQFGLLEEALAAMGVVVWPMVELEADDAIGGATESVTRLPNVEQVVIVANDKDLGQLVRGKDVVQYDRRKDETFDEAGVTAKFGVPPESIPDYLALVGDSADGFPGLKGWGAKSTATVLAHYRHLEDIPRHGFRWEVKVGGADRLAGVLAEQYDLALLFKDLATLRRTDPVIDDVETLRWRGPTDDFAAMCERLEVPEFVGRALAQAERTAKD